MRPLEILKFVLLITCDIGRLLQIWMIDSQMQPLKSSMSESDICLWTYFYVFKKLSVAFWFVILTDWMNRSDATCIICREEMTTAKKLICGHLFHVNCLRSWLERQHTCPTCRALVVPPENGTSSSGSRSDAHQQGNLIVTSFIIRWTLFFEHFYFRNESKLMYASCYVYYLVLI